MMPVEMVDTGDYVNFGVVSETDTDEMTVMAWVNIDALGSVEGWQIGYIVSQWKDGITGPGWGMGVSKADSDLGTTGGFFFAQAFSSDGGSWESDIVPSTDTWTHVAVTYDNSNVANDPTFYIGGDTSALTEITTPTGIAGYGSSDDLKVGKLQGGVPLTLDGKTADVRVYTKILSQSVIKDIVTGKLFDDTHKDRLVFQCHFTGATNTTKYDGTTLATDNSFIDEINGRAGTPEGGPLGHADTLLMFGE